MSTFVSLYHVFIFYAQKPLVQLVAHKPPIVSNVKSHLWPESTFNKKNKAIILEVHNYHSKKKRFIYINKPISSVLSRSEKW